MIFRKAFSVASWENLWNASTISRYNWKGGIKSSDTKG